MIISRSNHVAANGIISLFQWLGNIPLHIYILHYPIAYIYLLYPFLCWWTFMLLPRPGYCKQCCYEHWSALSSFQTMFFSGYVPSSGIVWSYGSSIFKFFMESPSWLYQVTLPKSSVGGLLFSTHFPVFSCGFFDDGHSDWCEVIPHCGFDLHFSNN